MAKKQKVAVVMGVVVCEYPQIGKVFKGELSKLPSTIYKPCLAADHGMKQKLGDAESGGTAQEKYEAVQQIWNGLLAGEWERTAKPDMLPLIIEAISRIKKVPLAKVQKAATGNEEKFRAYGSNSKVKAEILKIRSERLAVIAAEADDEEIDLE